MRVNTLIWSSISPDSDKAKNKKIQEGLSDKIIQPLPGWFKHGTWIELDEKELSEKILELLSLNFYIGIKKYITHVTIYVDTSWFRVK